jgi:photosystem II S4 domain protein
MLAAMVAFSVSLPVRHGARAVALSTRPDVLASTTTRAASVACQRARRGATRSAPTARAPSGSSPRDSLLKVCENRGVPREVADRVLSLAERAIRDWTAVTSEFVTPPEADALVATLGEMADVHADAWGGYPSAERRVVVVARSDVACGEDGGAQSLVGNNIALLAVTGNFLFDTATHRDFLGAILGAGITRQKVGDIIVLGDRGCQFIVSADVVDFLSGSLSTIRSVPVTVEKLTWEDLQVRPPSRKEMTITEASMRVDAVASAGFSMSRSKLADMIKAGDGQINYKPVSSPSKALKTGDIVSVRGKGKLEIGEVVVTRKERFRVTVVRYV